MLPDARHDFGDAGAVMPLRTVVGELDLPTLASGVPALAQQVLRTMLWHLDRIVDVQPRLSRDAAIRQCAEEFRAEWIIEKSGWEEALALMQGLGDLAHLRWDELRGRLTSREWREAQRIGAMLAHLQPLAELIRALGRAHHHPQRPPARSPQPAPQDAPLPLVERETRLPDAPGELMGIRHSDRIERMLGSEAVQMRHPVLHKLWRARLAESRLLTYQSEAVLIEPVPDPRGRARHHAAPQPERLERGPIILAVDTSGSMRGAPENIAKAVVLEALRSAHREKRGCLLIAFGGPDEIIERDLCPAERPHEGIDALLDLLGQSFDGGTDVQAPIERAVQRVRESHWRSADLLIVSDGEFGCTPATLQHLEDGAAGTRPACAGHPGRRPRDTRPARDLRRHPLAARLAALRRRHAAARGLRAGAHAQPDGAVLPQRAERACLGHGGASRQLRRCCGARARAVVTS